VELAQLFLLEYELPVDHVVIISGDDLGVRKVALDPPILTRARHSTHDVGFQSHSNKESGKHSSKINLVTIMTSSVLS